MRNSTLLVSGIWQRPDPFLGEYAVAQHLQHQSGKTEKQWPHSEECGGAEGRLRITPHCDLAGKCTRYELPHSLSHLPHVCSIEPAANKLAPFLNLRDVLGSR